MPTIKYLKRHYTFIGPSSEYRVSFLGHGLFYWTARLSAHRAATKWMHSKGSQNSLHFIREELIVPHGTPNKQQK